MPPTAVADEPDQMAPMAPGADSSQLDDGTEDAAESDQIKKFEADQKRPTDVKSVIEQMADDRDYVHTQANLPNTPGGVATNYILRYQWIHGSQIYAKDPSISVRQRRRLGVLVPAIQQILTDFGKTVEYIVQHCANEAELRPIVDGMIQDTDTTGIVFLKVNWMEDLGRDPTGTFRPNDLSSQVRTLTRLRDEYEAGKFQDTDARMAEMKELAKCIQDEMEAEHWRQVAYPSKRPQVGPDGQPVMTDQGIPVLDDVPYPEGQDPRRLRWDGVPTPPQITELPKYRGFVFDVFDAEDVGWDWTITRPELLHRGSHMDTRVWMTPEKIREDFGISVNDATDYLPTTETVARRDTPKRLANSSVAKEDAETGERDGLLAVWERQMADGYVYTWVKGAKKFLRKVKNDIATSSRFNVFPLYFNRVTGRVLPVSNVTLGRPLQDEINTVRTHKRQAKRAAYNRYIANKDLFTDAEKRKLEKCPPEGVIFINKHMEDIKAGFMPINGRFDPAVHDVGEEKQELSISQNMSVASLGQTKGGSDSATEAAIANQSSDTMAQRHRSMLEAFLQRIFTHMSEVLIQALPEDNAKAIAGPGAVWPMADREALWNHLEVDIEAGSTGKPDQQKRLESLKASVEIGNMMGVGQNPMRPGWNVLNGMRKLADINDWREDPADLLMMPPPLPPMPAQDGTPSAPGPGGGPAPGGAPQLPMQPPGPPGPPEQHHAPQMTNPNHMAGAHAPGMPQ